MPVLPQGTSTPLHRAHAGRTPGSRADLCEKPRRPLTSFVPERLLFQASYFRLGHGLRIRQNGKLSFAPSHG